MPKPRLFLGSSGIQVKLLQALTRGLEDVAHVGTVDDVVQSRDDDARPPASSWRVRSTSPRSCSPGTTRRITGPRIRAPGRRRRGTMSCSRPGSSAACSGCAARSSSTRAARSCRPISSASPACAYDEATDSGGNERRSTRSFGRRSRTRADVARIEGLWWQFSLTERTEKEPSAVSLLRIVARSRRRAGGRRPLVARETAACRRATGARRRRSGRILRGVFYCWKGERPRDPNAPQLDGTGEILLESVDRAAGYFTTRGASRGERADVRRLSCAPSPEDMGILDGSDDQKRAELIAERLARWKAIPDDRRHRTHQCAQRRRLRHRGDAAHPRGQGAAHRGRAEPVDPRSGRSGRPTWRSGSASSSSW